MNRLLRSLLHFHLRRPAGLWAVLATITLVLGWGVFRVERRLDLMSLLPTDHPVVRASIQAGVGQQELLWLAAEGSHADLEAREGWAEGLVEKLLDQDGVPLNGLSGEGRISGPRPVPGPMGASLWPPLLAAGSFLEGDAAAVRLVTGQFYALAPMLLGDKLESLKDLDEVRRRFKATARALASPDPAKKRLAQLDPLHLMGFLEKSNETLLRATTSARAFPLKIRSGYLITTDDRFVLVPLMLDFPSADTKATARVLAWLGRGAEGSLPAKVTAAEVRRALAPAGKRTFALQATGAHPIAYCGGHGLSGLVVNERAETNIPGLYAAGDTSCVAKGYLTGAFVFGEIAAEQAVRFTANQGAPKVDSAQIEDVKKKIGKRNARSDKRIDVRDIEFKVRRLINDYLPAPKNAFKLNRWLEWSGILQEELDEEVATENVHDLIKSFEVENIIKCATFSAVSSLERKESRWGNAHQRTDFPDLDDENWLCHVDLQKGDNGEVRAVKRPLNRRLASGGAL